MYKLVIISFLASIFILACEPQRDDDFMLGTAPLEPEFSLTRVDTNRYIYNDLSNNNFQRLWTFEGGTPKTSTVATDTVFFAKAGTFNVSLAVSNSDGSGSAFASKPVTILKDAPLTCSEKLALLTGDCGPDGKCWKFSQVAGAVKVGPSIGDYSWFASPTGGLVAEQYDDTYCFKYDGFSYENRNNGQSIDPWQGYIPVNIAYPAGDFEYIEGAGTGGTDLLIIPDDQFIGIMDSDNEMDVVTLTETDLVLRMRLRNQDGTPAAEGWFELVFVAE